MQHRVFIARSHVSIESSLLDHPAYSTILYCCQRDRWACNRQITPTSNITITAVRVPELTCATGIKLNKRVWLRPMQMSLAWLQSRRLAPEFSLRTARSGAASYPRGGPAPKTTAGITPHGLMPAQSAPRQMPLSPRQSPDRPRHSHNQRSPPG